VVIDNDLVTVVTVQTILGSQPDETGRILVYMDNVYLGQAVLYGQVLESENTARIIILPHEACG
jgi:hypothetical protein